MPPSAIVSRNCVIGIAVATIVIAGPALLGAMGFVRARRSPESEMSSTDACWNWKLTLSSSLLYVLAFNLTFFIQEFFLVLPKAFTPGLRPTLFHNNHSWEGEHPLASLFQGTGALAIFLSGVICALLLRRDAGRSATVRLLLIWMAYSGFFMALPQVVIGAISPASDVGMAMAFLDLGVTTRTVLALAALAAMPPVAVWLTRYLFTVAEDPARLAHGRARTRFVFYVATLPALVAILLIVPFRVPRELIEVVMVPVVVTVIGIAWMQACAWCVTPAKMAGSSTTTGSIIWPLTAVALLLFAFQVVLRPGIAFF